MGKSLLVAATSPFQQYNTGATALVSLDVFALQVTSGRSGTGGGGMCKHQGGGGHGGAEQGGGVVCVSA